MTYDRVTTLIDRLGVPVSILIFLGYLAYRFLEGPGNELARALIAYMKTATEQLSLLPGIVREEGARGRDETQRAHVETRALLTVLLQGHKVGGVPPAGQPVAHEDDTPLPPTPTQPAIRRSTERLSAPAAPAPAAPGAPTAPPRPTDGGSPDGERSSGVDLRRPLGFRPE
jgi:hypothetical protein